MNTDDQGRGRGVIGEIVDEMIYEGWLRKKKSTKKEVDEKV